MHYAEAFARALQALNDKGRYRMFDRPVPASRQRSGFPSVSRRPEDVAIASMSVRCKATSSARVEAKEHDGRPGRQVNCQSVPSTQRTRGMMSMTICWWGSTMPTSFS
jgi:hypothetical protein